MNVHASDQNVRSPPSWKRDIHEEEEKRNDYTVPREAWKEGEAMPRSKKKETAVKKVKQQGWRSGVRGVMGPLLACLTSPPHVPQRRYTLGHHIRLVRIVIVVHSRFPLLRYRKNSLLLPHPPRREERRSVLVHLPPIVDVVHRGTRKGLLSHMRLVLENVVPVVRQRGTHGKIKKEAMIV